jgi:hypothetical protein
MLEFSLFASPVSVNSFGTNIISLMKPEQREQKIKNESTRKPTWNISKQRINIISPKIIKFPLIFLTTESQEISCGSGYNAHPILT